MRNRFPSLLYLLVMMLDRVIAVVSKTQTSKLQTSDLENSDLETSDPLKNDEIVNAVLHECRRQVKGFLYFCSKQKRERQEQWQNHFTFSRVISGEKKT